MMFGAYLASRRRRKEAGHAQLQAASDVEAGRRQDRGRHERAADADKVGVTGDRVDGDVVSIAAEEWSQ
jgi:hypothetical protein